MSIADTGDLIGRIVATSFLAVAVMGGVWALAEFIIFLVQSKKWRRK